MGECHDKAGQPGREQFPSGEPQGPADLNAFNGKGPRGGWKRKHQPWKGTGKGGDKGKGGDSNKGKGKGQPTGLNASGDRSSANLPPNFRGCWICQGPHFARDCPKNGGSPAAGPARAGTVAPMVLCGVRVATTKPQSTGDSNVPERRGDVAGIPATPNPFERLEFDEQDDVGTPALTDSESEGENSCPPPPINRWPTSQWNQVRYKKKCRRPHACACCT